MEPKPAISILKNKNYIHLNLYTTVHEQQVGVKVRRKTLHF